MAPTDNPPVSTVFGRCSLIRVVSRNAEPPKSQSHVYNQLSRCHAWRLALDLVDSEQAVGGLIRVATVLAELAEEIHFATISPKLLDYFNTPVIQRLGYLLEAVLDEQEKSNELFALAQSANLRFRKVALKTTKEVSDDCELNKRWKIMVNQEIEIDELCRK